MELRRYRDDDINLVVTLFYETVHSVNARDYSQEQLNAWASMDEKESRMRSWGISLKQNITYVAELDGILVGFADMTLEGYLDRLYIHKDFQGRGIASALVKELEKDGERLGLSSIETDASITARPFFERRGYELLQAQTV
ncbi:GNAT family N-acetyltransferase [Paenibacillus sp. GCM10028914]|uniref:GNAT family N-acetyltransferase n=1 Tax=Paenibacillus sp. GCM10028914 TaxID=3273416 RepID=UPI00362392AC